MLRFRVIFFSQSHDRFRSWLDGNASFSSIVVQKHRDYISRNYGCIIIIRGNGGQAGKLMAGPGRARLSFTRFNDRVPKLNNSR